MTAAEGSFLGLAKQTAKGTPNTTDASFDYLLFREGQVGPQNMVIPLDPEVGGGAMLRNMVKVGVTSGAQLSIIPRPETLGHFFYGVTGSVQTTDDVGGNYATHVFKLGSDQFAAPYYTLRSAPGNMWGEQFMDCRINTLALQWRGASFVEGAASFLGGLPSVVSTAAWNALSQVDAGPQFLSPIGDIELPTGTDVSVLSGSFIAQSAIPLDEQFVVGSYSPQALDIVSRSFALQLAIKITDKNLYERMMFDPAQGGSWLADVFREARIKLLFNSDQEADVGVPYSFQIEANGQAGDDANIVWSAQQIAVRAQRQLVMAVTGMFTASPNPANDPITLTLVNKRLAAQGY
ncbi:MAG TPA: hypothetical protein PKD55_02390 [Bellilinea sp.]|nr:hypothetical protein [Bellilinea sp.]